MIRWIYLQCLVVGLASVGSIAGVLVLGCGSGLSSRLWGAGGSTIECSCLVAVLCRLGELSWLRSWLRSCTSSRHRRLLVTHNQINDRAKQGCRVVFFCLDVWRLRPCTFTDCHGIYNQHTLYKREATKDFCISLMVQIDWHFVSFLQWQSKALTDSHEIWIL